ncbi:hypothetical protein V8J88_03915 [Massilia sp. W12]|uniref:hypothetical protein n=1 Tax=Massilia sp. W12 TaxID=3126507 RepID=UPI0030D3E430
MEAALFESAHSALVFAHHYQPGEKTVLGRLAGPSGGGSGRGLGGLDGSAQAGMILRELGELSELYQALLIARTAPAWDICPCSRPCCSGRKANPVWVAAIGILSREAKLILGGAHASFAVRAACVKRHLLRKNERTPVDAMAAEYEINRQTMGKYVTAISKWLTNKEKDALTQFDTVLRELGMVGSADAVSQQNMPSNALFRAAA